MTWKIGKVSITSVIELDLWVDETFILPDATPENLAPDYDWLNPHFVNKEGLIKFRTQAFLVESSGYNIIIDTCVGNDKQRSEPAYNQLDGPFLDDIAQAGFDRHKVDIVVCTHLHYDHVGWNTMKVNGQWVPTFPNARYLITQTEFDHCRAQDSDFWTITFGDSVAPIFDAGLVDLVDGNYQITPELRLFPTPGHTPGHCSVAISSEGQEAMITGDIMHHPCQCAHPDWASVADDSVQQAEDTRREFLNYVGDTDITVIGTHWSAPRPVRVRSHKSAWKVIVPEAPPHTL